MTSTRTDVLFVSPNVARAVFQELSTSLKAVEPPIWGGLLAASMRKKGFSAGILDAEALDLSVEETVSQIADYHPRLVVMVVYGQQPSASTQIRIGPSRADGSGLVQRADTGLPAAGKARGEQPISRA